ncbi:MAG TPA: sugar ABC transporter permease [Candidatus Dorea gallistercoris]|uniref:Sugar ABC transporter permease n=1 Tax=Candidatus Dorea gallistercoris TaxID=2838542 RepID=A0A9D1R8W7_9FIRM|nr:sugar ABC transporter permease [Candidatus Dorea gallistercoris]
MKKKIFPYLLLAPMILVMGALVFYPIAATFSYSLKKWKLTEPGDIRFIGLDNYVKVLTSDSFWYSMQNTVFILIFVVVFTTVLGFLVASFLNIQVRFSGVLLALAVLPWALPPFVNGILWRFVFYSGYGFLNKLLIGMGLVEQPIEFLASRWSLLLVVSIVVVWRSVPFMALVCLAGRQSIPTGLYEAARIDGGSRWQIFRRITLPLMLPFVGVGVTSASVTAINVFDEIVSLSGYSDLGKNILMESYLTTFTFLDFGEGSAVTYIVMFFALILGIFYLKSLAKEVSYE